VVANAVAALAQHTGPSGLSAGTAEFQFDHVTAKPLSRETWLTHATAYRDHGADHDWILMTAMPEAFYLAGLRKANSRSAMVLALTLVLSLVLGAALASMVTAPLRHMAQATRTMAGGDLSVRVPGTKLEELDALAESFNAMAAKLKKSFDDLIGENSTRKSREQELKQSETRLRLSEERLKLAIDAASLGIWDWDVEQDRLVWDDSMYRLYGVRRKSSAAQSTPGRGALCRKTSREPRKMSRRRFAATAIFLPNSRCSEPTVPSVSFAASRKSSETRTAGPCAWSASTGMSRT
jgi:HAMP domain-containing protein